MANPSLLPHEKATEENTDIHALVDKKVKNTAKVLKLELCWIGKHIAQPEKPRVCLGSRWIQNSQLLLTIQVDKAA